ncbi:putative Fasciclin-like arabinogalactan protein [Hibiscus syriacus]|uniref:Fasciclin-like arabinogalactan protein n=1 Tax=Hibiscus syriacus TaxID=106335 RepID=A0A6A3C2M8_HIBSY|nr:putative Fasciclin-like arabinogalactan protein [Hibiscus syriacus]
MVVTHHRARRGWLRGTPGGFGESDRRWLGVGSGWLAHLAWDASAEWDVGWLESSVDRWILEIQWLRSLATLKNIAPKTEIIAVKQQAGLLIVRTGTPVSTVNSLTFLYVEFTKPVFSFEDSMIEVNGGRLIRQELSIALYYLTVMAIANNMESVSIPEGKVNDISGNTNAASNILEIIHYSTAAISTALHSFVTAGVLAKTLAAATLSLSSTNLGAIANWLLADQPIEYSETTKGLRWLIPRQKLPWKKNDRSFWPKNVYSREEPLSAGNVVKKLQNYKGGQDMEMNLFWLSIGFAILLMLHFALLVFLRWTIGAVARWMILVPRFELLLSILALPCISQSSALVIRGRTIEGFITGALLLAIPAAFILSVCLFLIVAVFTGSLVQYKEIRYGTAEEQCFCILFEDHKGPPIYIFVDQNDTNTMARRVGSGQHGIRRMRAVSSDDSHEEMKIPLPIRVLGCARSSYIVLDLLRRVCLGVIAGSSYWTHKSSQSLCALMVTLVQFICLFTLKPHIRRGVFIVESISLLSEACMFGLSNRSSVAFPPKEALDRSHTRFFKREIGLSSGPSSNQGNRVSKEWSKGTPCRATKFMTATIVLLLSPGSGSPIVQATGTTAETALVVQKTEESTKNDLKNLREMAKASFSGKSKHEKSFMLQTFSYEIVSNDPQTSTSNVISNDPQSSTPNVMKYVQIVEY